MSNIVNNSEDKKKPLYSISSVARILDCSVHSLRMYEREGLILTYKKDTNHRLYSQYDVERLECIRKAISESKYSIQSIKTLFSMIPCWSIKNCSKEDRENCDAYQGYSMPCWTYKNKGSICESEKCIDCTVYNEHTNCCAIKDSIKKQTK